MEQTLLGRAVCRLITRNLLSARQGEKYIGGEQFRLRENCLEPGEGTVFRVLVFSLRSLCFHQDVLYAESQLGPAKPVARHILWQLFNVLYKHGDIASFLKQ